MNLSLNSLTDQAFKTSNYTRAPYLVRITPGLLASFNEQERATVQKILASATPKPAPKLVDLKFTIDLVISRFYVVLLVGKDRRKTARSHSYGSFTRQVDVIVAVLLLMGLNISISAFIVLATYLIKSAIGIDLFAFHLKDLMAQL